MGTRVVVAGLGDTGTLCAIHLSQSAEVVGISPKPGLISGQELGMRLARPHAWAREYALGYHRYRGLDRVSIRQAQITAAHLDTGTIEMMRPDGTRTTEHFDILIIATGARNGFWRTPGIQTADDRSGSVAATSPTANTLGYAGIRRSGSTRTNPASSSTSAGNHSVLGSARPTAQITTSAVVSAWPVVQPMVSPPSRVGTPSTGSRARWWGCNRTPASSSRRRTRRHVRGWCPRSASACGKYRSTCLSGQPTAMLAAALTAEAPPPTTATLAASLIR